MKDLTAVASDPAPPANEASPATGARWATRVTPVEGLSWARMLAWLERQREQGEAIVAWSDPEEGLEWVASGTLVAAEVSCLKELERVRSAWIELEPEPRLPLAWVGAAFDPGRCDGPWEGWPAALAVVPRRLVWLRRPASGPPQPPVGQPEGDASALASEWPPEPEEPPGPAGGVLIRAEDPARAEAELLATLSALEGAAPAPGGSPAAGLARHAPERPDSWAARVREALEAAGRGELDKVVLARAVAHSLPPGAACAGRGWDVAGTLERLRAEDPAAILYAFSPGPERGCFLGATPELLVRVRGRRVEAVALAGTARRGRDEADDQARGAALLASDKDQREHALVSQAIRAVLRPACRLLHQPRRPGLRVLPRLLHLETRFLGLLAARGRALSLAAALHPTPAVAGAPREPALEWLRQREPLGRGWFAGPVGWIDARGGGTLAVALRCALLRGPRAWSFAGAGIVPGSDPAAEWLETEGKLATISRALQVGADRAPSTGGPA